MWIALEARTVSGVCRRGNAISAKRADTPMPALTDLKIANSKGLERSLSSFPMRSGLRLITPSGSRLWRMKYRFAEGEAAYSRPLSRDDARNRRGEKKDEAHGDLRERARSRGRTKGGKAEDKSKRLKTPSSRLRSKSCEEMLRSERVEKGIGRTPKAASKSTSSPGSPRPSRRPD